MEDNTPFIGLNNLYITDWKTKRTLFLPRYNGNHAFGAGRMLHNGAIKVLPWPDMENSNMDMYSREKLKRYGVHETVVDCGRTPYIIDIKTDTNIGHFELLKNWHDSELVEYNDICSYFGLVPIYPGWVLALQDVDGFIGYVENIKKGGRTDCGAYEETEGIYKMYFGSRKYKNYKVFDETRRRGKHNHSL